MTDDYSIFMKRSCFFLGSMAKVLLLSACHSSQSNVVGDPSALWIAFEAATAQESFRYVHVDVTLDGESLSHQMKYMQAAEPYSVTGTDSGRQFEASRVKYTVFLPQLSPAEHVVIWNFAMAADLENGGFSDPAELTTEYAIVLNVEQ